MFDYEDREDFINSYKCNLKADTLGYFSTANFVDEKDNHPEKFIVCNNAKVMPDKKYPISRYDAQRGSLWEDHIQRIYKANNSFFLSLLELRRIDSKSRPLRGYNAMWNYSISYRKPGAYLEVFKRINT